jgi:REP element-mobilizing transposase RayT
VAAHPLHVTLRATTAVRCLRSARVYPAALAAASHATFRIFQFSVQDDHVHLLVEADDAHAFSSGLRGLTIRVARAVNRALGRRGPVWADRYHARALATPRAVRNALVYVLMNLRKHHGGEGGIDPCSSAPWFEGWREPISVHPTGPSPVHPARTWLAAAGWKRRGLIGVEQGPRAAEPTSR